jgi:hypothetical protein
MAALFAILGLFREREATRIAMLAESLSQSRDAVCV